MALQRQKEGQKSLMKEEHIRYSQLLKESQYRVEQIMKENLKVQADIIKENLVNEIRRRREKGLRYGSVDYNDNFTFGLRNEPDPLLEFEEEEEVNEPEGDFHNINYNNIEPENNNEGRHNHHHHSHHHHHHHHHNHKEKEKRKNSSVEKKLEEILISQEILDKTDDKSCSICLDNYKINDKISYLPCFHCYHSKCIKKWLKRTKICPLCKAPVNV